MFSNLDNFLSGATSIKIPQNDLPDESFSNANDSFDLDLSLGASQKKAKSKSKDNSDVMKDAKFVPAKGQKMITKRLQKIGDTLANKMEQTNLMRDQMDRKNAKKSKPSKAKASKHRSPNKRLRASSRRMAAESSQTTDSSDDEPLSRPSRPVHDPNTIVLDCDDEFIGGPAVNFSRNIAQASAVSVEESMDLRVSVRIYGKIEQFQTNAYQKLSTIIAKISDDKNVPVDNIALMYKDKIVSEHDTPDSIGYTQGMVMKAHISDMVNKNKNTADSASDANSNKLEIKIQSEGRKRPFITYIGATDKLITLAFLCSQEFKCDVEKVVIEFDGEFINFKETAEDLGLDGGEVMDFFLKK